MSAEGPAATQAVYMRVIVNEDFILSSFLVQVITDTFYLRPDNRLANLHQFMFGSAGDMSHGQITLFYYTQLLGAITQ